MRILATVCMYRWDLVYVCCSIEPTYHHWLYTYMCILVLFISPKSDALKVSASSKSNSTPASQNIKQARTRICALDLRASIVHGQSHGAGVETPAASVTGGDRVCWHNLVLPKISSQCCLVAKVVELKSDLNSAMCKL